MANRQKEDYTKEAQQILKDHQYKQLASWGEGGSEVWECSCPGSSCYAFTICITRMGIAVVGDIDGLTFNVGNSYGMPFLAGKDVSYYIHSKLEQACREKELNRDRYLEYVANRVVRHMAENHLDELKAAGFDIPDWLEDDTDDGYADYQRVYDFVYHVYDRLDPCHDLWDWFHDCYNLMESADGASEIHEAYDLPDLDGVDFDWGDAPSFEKPRESLMVRLYMVNEAAKRIMEIKETAIWRQAWQK